MPNYRRMYVPGGTYFFTIVTYQRQPIFANSENISLLRKAIATVKSEMPFTIIGAVILPDHLHFIWELPPGDSTYSSFHSWVKNKGLDNNWGCVCNR